MENYVDKITLIDEDGEEIEFDVITKLDIEEEEYVIVVASGEEDLDAIALKIKKDEEGNDLLVPVEDEDEFEMISEAYEAIFEE
ncbi:DUF1292 domain-containing protein [Clostridium sp. UBA2485]|uniref:DUF1292 domain-containing protein n=1 Tax=Clostridium sp. UBA2485 TaxID=1946352 RepID=UPI0025BD73EE|nr:DUF1292 domain-containing protein [Clostridium sp. UBA2485]